jgi:hypothetical protein
VEKFNAEIATYRANWAAVIRSANILPLAAWGSIYPRSPLLVEINGEARTRSVRFTTSNFLDVLGLRPQLGRYFSEAEDRRDAPFVAVISDRFWRREFGADPAVLGRSDKFRELAHELALQIAASAPRYLKAEEIPAEVLEHEAEIARARAKEEGKPDNVMERIVQGRLEKFKDEVVLSRQAYIRDESLTVEKLILSTVAAIGENVIVRRFQRWELGESLNN